MDELETVVVQSASGWVRINLSDFDPAVHVLYDDGVPRPVETVTPEPVAPVLRTRGRPPKVR